MLKIYSYNRASASAKALAEGLQVKRVKNIENIRRSDTVINWGSSSLSCNANVINSPSAIYNAVNKLRAFRVMKEAGVSVPDFTQDKEEAYDWLDDGYKVVIRHKLEGTNGEGIDVMKPGGGELPDAPLYVRYIRKDEEYRVHVFRGRVIDYVEKRKRNGEEAHPYIRSYGNGWVFCRSGVELPSVVEEESIKAVAALGLDFGAVDVVYRKGKAVVLEVNTAPGIEGTTLRKYIETFSTLVPVSRVGRSERGYRSWMSESRFFRR